MSNTSVKQQEQLGMPYGTACNRLRRNIMFSLLERLGETKCCKCGEKMTVNNFTVEHLEPWMHNNPELFWDISNISFSHSHCNRPHSYNLPVYKHGTFAQYQRGCRCELCKAKKAIQNKQQHKVNKKKIQKETLGYVPNGTKNLTPKHCYYGDHEMPTEAFAWVNKSKNKLNTLCKPCNSKRALKFKNGKVTER